MKKSILLACAILTSSHAFASEHAHWGYAGEGAPENWASLSGDNFACTGKNQSPINLTGFIESELVPLVFNYQVGGNEILNNGHTVQVNYQKGSGINIDGKQFNLLQFHFHSPSENNINGESYPLEAHLVHADKDGNLAVVAVMFKEGAENKGLAAAWKQIPMHEGDKNTFVQSLDANDILPENKNYYRFNGSLTTPPCSEGVRWFVMKEVITASKAQIDAFKATMHGSNNRPLQAVNSRVILE
jgi:carbonic anhydrase